jgi:hypothetical protein
MAMISDQEIKDFQGKYLGDIIQELQFEVGLLREWFRSDFPESDLKVVVDADNITRTLSITTSVLMGEKMVDNRGFFKNTLVLHEKEIINPLFMRGFFKEFNNGYRKQISEAVNRHYLAESQKSVVQ